MKRPTRAESIPDYVDTLDGFRAMAACLVLAFHYWQQSWIGLSFKVFGYRIDLSNIVTNGAFGVELLFMLSGFCLYLPLAMHPERRLSLGNYVYKRAVRILPSYFLCVIVSAATLIGQLEPAVLREQFIGNMTLTQMMTPALAYNRINGVLWSIAIEVQFYVIFPLLVIPFRKKPWWVMVAAFAVSEGLRLYLRDVNYDAISFWMNQLPAMLDVFVAGMLAGHVVALLRHNLDESRQRALGPAFAMGVVVCLMLVLLAMVHVGTPRYRDMPENLSRLRMTVRKYLVAGFAGAIVCSVPAARWVHGMLGNRVARFLSGISYQLYLWHMFFGLRLKAWRIPAYATERPMDDVTWRLPYLLLCLGLSLATSVILTYGFERPIARFAMKHIPRWAKPKPAGEEAAREQA